MVVNGIVSAAIDDKKQKTPGQRHIFHEMDHFILVGKISMEN